MKTDPELLAEARNDPEAFRHFYERHALTLGRWLRRRTDSTDVAAELVAETFAQAWFSLRRFKGEEEDSGARWIFGIAKNVLGTYLRKRQVAQKGRRKLGMMLPKHDPGEYERVHERLEAESAAPALHEAIGTLPGEQWEALEMRIVAQLPYSEVASRLGCTENAARLRVSRALRELRTTLEAEGG